MRIVLALVVVAACAPPVAGRFPLRAPLTVDGDTRPVSVPCRQDPDKHDPHRVTCAPRPYFSPFAWDEIDNLFFARISRALSAAPATEAANANSFDEVADSAWFTNRIGAHVIGRDEELHGACKPDDFLLDDVPDGTWVVDHGKDNGATAGFRVKVPGKGKYLLKADDPDQPERASAASAIGTAIYHVVGFNTSCEQVVYVSRAQLTLLPGLVRVKNTGITAPFDDAALARVLATTAHRDGRSRLEASKWLDGLPLGPFRYLGTRDDDPNDVIPHDARRELRGARLLAAWLNHWDSREQNSMDIWIAQDAAHERSSPGYVRHYILDTSDAFGQGIDAESTSRLGFSYELDWGYILTDLVTFGALERPWDRVRVVPGREKFGFFSAEDFEPDRWRGAYPNPAFIHMTERDGAWMARIIARLSPDDVRALVGVGRFSDPGDAAYLSEVLIARQRMIFARYLTRLSPLTDVHADDRRVCALDLARVRDVVPAARFRYRVTTRASGRDVAIEPDVKSDGLVCFDAPVLVPDSAALADDAPERVVVFLVDDGIGAGPLEIHTYDLGARGLRVVGLVRPEPR